jgi:hypothetical protein
MEINRPPGAKVAETGLRVGGESRTARELTRSGPIDEYSRSEDPLQTNHSDPALMPRTIEARTVHPTMTFDLLGWGAGLGGPLALCRTSLAAFIVRLGISRGGSGGGGGHGGMVPSERHTSI